MLIVASINPIAFQLGSLQVRWYGILIALGALLGTWIAARAAQQLKLKAELIYDFLLYGGIGGIVCARLYYVVFNWSYFVENPQKIIAIWEGGIAIHGALIGGFLGILLFSKLRKIKLLPYLDCVALGLPIAQSIGRWGNFINQEAFGRPTDLPWGIYIDPARRPHGYLESEYFHPTFLYESLWNLVVFGILLWILKKVKFKTGDLLYVYFIAYSLGRVFIEGIRTDSLMLGSLRAAQIVSVSLILLGIILLGLNHKKSSSNPS
ncbi:MAG: prolipoprotein diacylglyceryl transferase [Candidatus Gracilibacteria bacterium]|nr:prolipoprotein diacylglyceryl transferase [Candidatus Gracilibacteria bacterium]